MWVLLLDLTEKLNWSLILGKTWRNSEMTHKDGGDKEAEFADKERNGVTTLKNVFFTEEIGEPRLQGLTLSQFYYCTSISCGFPAQFPPVD